jgi:DNA uptake protein ComE-like DNA-binding protein
MKKLFGSWMWILVVLMLVISGLVYGSVGTAVPVASGTTAYAVAVDTAGAPAVLPDAAVAAVKQTEYSAGSSSEVAVGSTTAGISTSMSTGPTGGSAVVSTNTGTVTISTASSTSNANKPSPVPPDDRVNINAATYTQLRSIGFSVMQARTIKRYIERKGDLRTVDDLRNIPFISTDTIRVVKDKLKAE